MEMTTVKTIAVFMIIFGCFAVLYPKIFHPILLNLLGLAARERTTEDLINSRMSPHLKKPGKGVPISDDIARHMRAGPHPGMRAAAEMKKQAATQGTGSGRGMMSIVLPMYAVGIVIYLIYTMSKVFGGRKMSEKHDYLTSHFSDVRYDPDRQKFVSTMYDDPEDLEGETVSKKFKRGRKDLERLLLKADKNNISGHEMQELKRRLLETEAQMTSILAAMEAVQKQTMNMQRQAAEEEESGEWQEEQVEEVEEVEAESPPKTESADQSPDMDSYEILKDQPSDTPPEGSSTPHSPSIEDLGAELGINTEQSEEYTFTNEPEEQEGEEEEGLQEDPEMSREYEEEQIEEVVMEDTKNEESGDEHPDLRKRAPHEQTIS